MNDLAIVIPAYKEIYFEKALESLAKQSNKNFKVYIGDDCSPHNLLKIVTSYNDRLNIYYERFADNTGAKNLVKQWDRCVALTKGEKWLWLFSDDDLADHNCVENFYASIEGSKFDVFRFNTIIIDKYDAVKEVMPQGPEEESSVEMAYNLLLGKRGNSMPDHIFSKEVYDKNKGFVFTEYAQGADWATSILFSKEKGIKIISGAFIYWRCSGVNISSIASKNRNLMMNGHIQFVDWILQHFNFLKTSSNKISYNMILSATTINLKSVLKHHFGGFNMDQAVMLFKLFNKRLKLPFIETIALMINIQEYKYPILLRLKYRYFWIKNKFRKR